MKVDFDIRQPTFQHLDSASAFLIMCYSSSYYQSENLDLDINLGQQKEFGYLELSLDIILSDDQE